MQLKSLLGNTCMFIYAAIATHAGGDIATHAGGQGLADQ